MSAMCLEVFRPLFDTGQQMNFFLKEHIFDIFFRETKF